MTQLPLLDPSPRIQIEEVDQADHLVATYIQSTTVKKSSRIDVIIPKNANSLAKNILNAFLPAGYPHSVTGDYLEYQIYDSLQAFSSSIAGMLSNRAVLEGIGVGDSSASPTAALLLSVLQESLGRMATILFAHRLGTAFEPECKMYRLAADVFNDAAMLLDCLSPALPKAPRVGLLSLSGVLRSLCGVAAGSSKASLSAHFATQGNLGELNAKDSSQETVISLLGMLAGSLVVSVVSSKAQTWALMIFLLTIHLGTNYMAVKAVCMRTLNRQRANLVFSACLDQLIADESYASQNTSRKEIPSTSGIKYPTPEDVASCERVFELDGVLRWKGGRVLGYCQVGIQLQTLLGFMKEPHKNSGSYSLSDAYDIAELLRLFSDRGYIMWYDRQRMTFLVVLKADSDAKTIMRAWMHALYFAKSGLASTETILNALERTELYTSERFPAIFENLRNNGWDLETGALETRPGTRLKVDADSGSKNSQIKTK